MYYPNHYHMDTNILLKAVIGFITSVFCIHGAVKVHSNMITLNLVYIYNFLKICNKGKQVQFGAMVDSNSDLHHDEFPDRLLFYFVRLFRNRDAWFDHHCVMR